MASESGLDYTIRLPNGEALDGTHPIVLIGPNGSGKTRQTRNLSVSAPIEFINALRNTRVAPELPAMGMDTATNNFRSQRDQARTNHWDLASEFDYMLSRLLAQKSMAAIEFTRRFETDPTTAGSPEVTALTRVERLWAEVFPGRELHWRDWKPLIKNKNGGSEVEYLGNTMSDGEKAALFLAGRVFSADAGILVVDEPETHFHSFLAVRLWNALEEARPDIRFVYVTHDLTFALSRKGAQFVLANPTAGLRVIDVDECLPTDVASALLGSASLSFYASRLVFCEGDENSLDPRLYRAWFRGPDTVVRGVGNCQRVLRCVEAVRTSGIAMSLEAVGIVDSDYHAGAFKDAMPSGVRVLRVHEVESLLCLPEVVAAVCAHLGRSLEEEDYRREIAATCSDAQRHQIIVERWKARIEPSLTSLVAGVSKKQKAVEDLIAELPDIFDHNSWSFSPAAALEEERDRVEGVVPDGTICELLSVVPGKQLLPIAAKRAGLNVDAYVAVVTDALVGLDEGLTKLGEALDAALRDHLPLRSVTATVPAAAEAAA